MDPQDYLEALINLPQIWSAIPSDDGRWVAWSWWNIHAAAEVYAVPADGSQPPLRLTNTPENTWPVSWAPDGLSVIVAQDHDGNERIQLFRVWLERPGIMEPLTESDPGYYLYGGMLHPNGRDLIYTANLDIETGQEIETSRIYRHDLQTDTRTALTRPQKPGSSEPLLSPDGAHILYTRIDRQPGATQLWLVDTEGQHDREILDPGPGRKVYAAWFPDSQRVLVLAETETHPRVGVWRLGDGSLRWLLDDPGRNPESVHIPRNSGQIVLIEERDARKQLSLLDPESGRETPLPLQTGTLIPLGPCGDGQWTGMAYSSTQPVDIVRFDPARPGEQTSLSRIWEHTTLKPEDLTPAEDFRWQADDGLTIQGWLYRARGEARGTIIYVHGGPTWHSEDWVNPQIQFYTSQGFHVLDPNYRGSTGFGRAFKEAIKEDGWGGREQDDIRAGIEALIAAGIAEPGKVGITGTSYGGYSSWCAITRFPPEIVAAAAPVCGMTDLVVDYDTTRPDLRPYSEEMMGGRPDEIPEKYAERSPINYIYNISGALLIVQGLQDPNVTPENVHVVTAALHDSGIEYRLLTFDDEGHGISRPKNRKTLYQELVRFFTQSFSVS